MPFEVYDWMLDNVPGGVAKSQRAALPEQAEVHEEAAVVPTESWTPRVKLKVPAAVGVPVIAPVVVFRFRPAGRDPAATENVYGAIPPVTTGVDE